MEHPEVMKSKSSDIMTKYYNLEQNAFTKSILLSNNEDNEIFSSQSKFFLSFAENQGRRSICCLSQVSDVRILLKRKVIALSKIAEKSDSISISEYCNLNKDTVRGNILLTNHHISISCAWKNAFLN